MNEWLSPVLTQGPDWLLDSVPVESSSHERKLLADARKAVDGETGSASQWGSLGNEANSDFVLNTVVFSRSGKSVIFDWFPMQFKSSTQSFT